MADHARAVIIGGGVGGTSIAYHLAERGWTDIVLVDRAELTSGSTFHSAGLVGQLRGSVTLTTMMMYGAGLYRRLRDETGVDPSWHEVGSLRLASSRARFEELQRQASWAKTFGLPLELISADEARERFPLMSTDGVHPGLPQLRDPDNLVYYREEVGGLCMGGYERNPAPWSLDGVPPDFNGKLLPPDWPRFEEIMAGAVRRVPAIADAGVSRIINGPEGFTPDNEFMLGESEVRGFFVAAGFSAHGIAGAGGIGRQVASWIVDGEPELDLWHMDIRRFGGQHWRSREWTLARTTEVYATYYDIHYPNEERQAGRPLRMAPTYDRLRALGAAFGEKSGWERPNWFEPNADDPRFGGRSALDALRPRGWAGEHWSPAIAAEALATREPAGLFDETSFAKIEVVARGACAFR